jgi:hypothetical protein
MYNRSVTDKLVEELLSFVDDGTLTEEERAVVTQAIQTNSLTEEEEVNAGMIAQLQAALAATRLPGENKAADGTLVQSIVMQLQVQRNSGTASDATRTRAVQDPGDSDVDDVDLAGQTIGNYRILQRIGRGGMGAVYEATDILLHRNVALKVMLPTIAARLQNRTRFLREARAAASVEHDHICPIYQVGEDRGIPFIAMPLLPGETLEASLKQGRLSYLEIIDIIDRYPIDVLASRCSNLAQRWKRKRLRR